MEHLYIDGNLLITTTEKVVFNSITMYASKPQIAHKKVTTDKDGIYTISDDSYSNSVFLNVYVKGGVTFYKNSPRFISTALHPQLKSELDEINLKVLEKLNADTAVFKLVLMGYFAQFELYLMEMTKLFIMFDEKHIRIFVDFLKRDCSINIYGKKGFLEKESVLFHSSTLFDMMVELKSFISDMFVFHRFDNITAFFSKVYGINIPSFGRMSSYYKQYRHDLIHRNGRNKEDTIVYISRSLVDEVYKEMVEYAALFDSLKNRELQLE